MRNPYGNGYRVSGRGWLKNPYTVRVPGWLGAGVRAQAIEDGAAVGRTLSGDVLIDYGPAWKRASRGVPEGSSRNVRSEPGSRKY